MITALFIKAKEWIGIVIKKGFRANVGVEIKARQHIVIHEIEHFKNIYILKLDLR